VLRREATVRYDPPFSLRLSSRLSIIRVWGGRKTWHRWDPQPQSSRLHVVVLGSCDCSGPQVQNALLHHIVPWRGGSRENGDGEGRIPCSHSIAPLPGGEKPYKALSRQQIRFLENSSWCDTISASNTDGFPLGLLRPCWVEKALTSTSSLELITCDLRIGRAYQRIYLPRQQHEWLALGWSQDRPNT
jgi:hypothetical protein